MIIIIIIIIISSYVLKEMVQGSQCASAWLIPLNMLQVFSIIKIYLMPVLSWYNEWVIMEFNVLWEAFTHLLRSWYKSTSLNK